MARAGAGGRSRARRWQAPASQLPLLYAGRMGRLFCCTVGGTSASWSVIPLVTPAPPDPLPDAGGTASCLSEPGDPMRGERRPGGTKGRAGSDLQPGVSRPSRPVSVRTAWRRPCVPMNPRFPQGPLTRPLTPSHPGNGGPQEAEGPDRARGDVRTRQMVPRFLRYARVDTAALLWPSPS